MLRNLLSSILLPGFLFCLCVGPVNSADGASLWLNGRDLYSMKGGKQYHVGDIVTISVAEESTAQSAATTNTKDDSQLEVKGSPQIPILKNVVNQLTGKHEVKNQWQGNGTTSRSGKLTGTITASVLEILPNGNLMIEGTRSIRVNRETQLMRVRGIARPEDIDANNTIKSNLLAEAEIKYDGKGAVGRTQRTGFITKIATWIF